MKKTLFYSILFLIIAFESIPSFAQNSLVSTGGDGTGSGGTFSFSFGQFAYQNYMDATGSVEQGVQHAFEFSDNLNTVPETLAVIDKTIASGDLLCFNAQLTLTVAGAGHPVLIQQNGVADFIAGQSIRFLPGFHAETGSLMHASITTNGSFCDVSGSGSIVMQPEVKSAGLAEPDVESITANELQVKVYPNPSNGKFTIELNDTEPDITAIIYDLSGSTICRSTSHHTNQLEVEMPDIRKGIYFLRIMSGAKQFGRKIIIE